MARATSRTSMKSRRVSRLADRQFERVGPGLGQLRGERGRRPGSAGSPGPIRLKIRAAMTSSGGRSARPLQRRQQLAPSVGVDRVGRIILAHRQVRWIDRTQLGRRAGQDDPHRLLASLRKAPRRCVVAQKFAR